MDDLDMIEPDPDWKFETKQQVTWTDEDEGISTGLYMVIERIELAENPDYNLYLLSNGRFNVEAYQKDLS